MPQELKPGARVRVAVRNRLPGYLAGDKGTVLRAAVTGPSVTRYICGGDGQGRRGQDQRRLYRG
jgi:hypothetical protein